MSKSLRSCASSLLLLAWIGCATAPGTAGGKQDLVAQAEVARAKAEANDSSLVKLVREGTGCAVFPSVGKGAVGVGGAYGKGVLFENGRAVGYCDLTQASIGLQLGGQAYTEILVFSTPEALARFKTGSFAFDAQATAVGLKSGAAANASFANGVAVFTTDAAGLMFEASVGGQKFSYQVK